MRSQPHPDPGCPNSNRKLGDRLPALLAAATCVKVSSVSPSACFYCIASKQLLGFQRWIKVASRIPTTPRASWQANAHFHPPSHQFTSAARQDGGDKRGRTVTAARRPLQLIAMAVTHTFLQPWSLSSSCNTLKITWGAGIGLRYAARDVFVCVSVNMLVWEHPWQPGWNSCKLCCIPEVKGIWRTKWRRSLSEKIDKKQQNQVRKNSKELRALGERQDGAVGLIYANLTVLWL